MFPLPWTVSKIFHRRKKPRLKRSSTPKNQHTAQTHKARKFKPFRFAVHWVKTASGSRSEDSFLAECGSLAFCQGLMYRHPGQNGCGCNDACRGSRLNDRASRFPACRGDSLQLEDRSTTLLVMEPGDNRESS